MDKETIKKYIGHKVFLTLRNGLKYKIILNQECIVENNLSFTGKYGEPIDLEISEISFITVSNDEVWE